MTYEILDIITDQIEDEFLERIIDYIEERDYAEYPKDPKIPREAIKADLLRRDKEKIKFQKVVVEQHTNKVIALTHLNILTKEHPEYSELKQQAKFDLTVLKEYLYLEIIEELFISTIGIVKNYNYVTIIQGCNLWEEEWKLWEKYGGKLYNSVKVSRLYFDEANWELMEQWREEGRNKASQEEISVKIFEKCPEEILEEYSQLYTEIGKLIPYSEEDGDEEEYHETVESRRGREEVRKSRGFIWLTAVTQEKDGRLSGLCEIVYDPKKSHITYQLLTGVRPQYRGRGLGKLLKAEIALLVKERFPDVIVIHTGNSKVNAPMLSINKRMGFRTVLNVKCFQLRSVNIE